MDHNDIDLDWSTDNEELIHAITQTNEPQALSNAVLTSNSSRRRSLDDDDDDAIINNICSNPALLKRLKNMLDSVDSSVSPDNNASEMSSAMPSALHHLSSDKKKDQSKASSCGLIERPDSVSHSLMLFELGQEARVFLLSKCTKELTTPLANIRQKIHCVEDNPNGLGEFIKIVSVNRAYEFDITKILCNDMSPNHFEFARLNLINLTKEVTAAVVNFHHKSKATVLTALNATEADLMEKLRICHLEFHNDTLLFLRSSGRQTGLTHHDESMIVEIAKRGLTNELENCCSVPKTPTRSVDLLFKSASFNNVYSSSRSALQTEPTYSPPQKFASCKLRRPRWKTEQRTHRLQEQETSQSLTVFFFHNISGINLTNSQIRLLNNGLKFIVTPPCLPDQAYVDAFNKFARSIRIKYSFLTSVDAEFNILYVPNPDYIPPSASSTIEDYIDSCRTHLMSLLLKYPMKFTNTDEQRVTSLIAAELTSKGLIIKPADKNLGPVVMNTFQYKSLCLDILLDTNTYKVVTAPSTDVQFKSLTAILTKCHVDLKSHLAKFLLQGQFDKKTTCTAKFYILPKMHKNPIVGRPIVSNINYTTYYASRWLHHTLEPLLTRFPAYLKDSKEVILDLEQLVVPKHCILMTADVTSLYPSIPTSLGLMTLRHTLSIETDWSASKIELILELSSWVLNNMYLHFDEISYLQTNGTAMGTPFAVVYAIIYLHFHESRVLEKLRFTPIYFKRFIDDILVIVHSRQQAIKFLENYNDVYANIILTSNIGESVDFLDNTIFKGHRLGNMKRLDCKTFQKPQNRYLYIPPTSYHDSRVFVNLITSELKRYCLTCSIASDFIDMKSQFFERLKNRGYSSELISTSCENLTLDRDLLLLQLRTSRDKMSIKDDAKPESFRLIYQHNPRYIPFTKEGWGALPEFIFQDQFSPFLFNKKRPVLFVKKNPPSLSKLLCLNL